MTRSEVVQTLLSEHARSPVKSTGVAYAPANIALCKYWGKRDADLHLPVTSSLSVSLGPLGTHAKLTPDAAPTLSINDETIPIDSPVAQRCHDFLALFDRGPFRVETRSTVPVGAGLASSASAFAALTTAADDLFGWDLPLAHRSILARLGSGSASRSVVPGFVEWQVGERADGMDSHALPLDVTWPDLRIGILHVSDAPKPIGSRPAMHRTRETAVLYESWPAQVARDLPVIRDAIHNRDLARLGPAAEANALSMHATMLASWPPILYAQPETTALLHRIWKLRKDGLSVFITIDAGPNPKLIFEAAQTAELEAAFPGLEVVAPFQTERG